MKVKRVVNPEYVMTLDDDEITAIDNAIRVLSDIFTELEEEYGINFIRVGDDLIDMAQCDEMLCHMSYWTDNERIDVCIDEDD